jgi:hypothetical protein
LGVFGFSRRLQLEVRSDGIGEAIVFAAIRRPLPAVPEIRVCPHDFVTLS